MSRYSRPFRAQKGAALMVALVILTLTMVVGVSSLKQGVVQSKIASNTNASSLAFQAADSAVENVLAEFESKFTPPPGQQLILAELGVAAEAHRCVGGEVSAGVCNMLQGPGRVSARSATARMNIPDRPMTGSSTNTVVWRFYKTTGTGRVADLAQVSNEQEFVRREIAASNNVFEETGSGEGRAVP